MSPNARLTPSELIGAIVRRRPPQGELHLLEVGLRWPPETFLCRKLEGLAASGLRVTVASKAIFEARAHVRGVDLVEIPQRGMKPWPAVHIVAREGILLLVTSPRLAVRLWGSVRRVPTDIRSHYGGVTGLLAMCARLARLRPDVVHFEWTTAATAYLPLFEVWGCPVVTSARGAIDPQIPGREQHSSRLHDLFQRTTVVHCVCESLRREAIALGLDPIKARVITQGVDPEVFRPAQRNGTTRGREDHGSFRVVTVSWLRWMKGYEYALEAIAALVARGVPVQYEIVGASPPEQSAQLGERERILHTVADLSLEGHVHLRGAAAAAAIVSALQCSDALLHPSVDEGLPNVLIEAMSCGVPLVATDCGGVSEALADGVHGFLVPPRDPAALAAALLKLWRSPSLRARMGEAGRATVIARFTLERQREQYLSMYRELATASA
jgi:glycosyltransferase involved in cell wall biosynthesis